MNTLTKEVNVGKCKVKFSLKDGSIIFTEFEGSKPSQMYHTKFFGKKIDVVYEVSFWSAEREATRFIYAFSRSGLFFHNDKMVKFSDIIGAEIVDKEDLIKEVEHSESYNLGH